MGVDQDTLERRQVALAIARVGDIASNDHGHI